VVHAGSAAGFGRQKESGRAVEQLINPFLLFLGLAIGGVGLCAALPRRRVNPQVLGAVLGGLGLGVVLLALGLKNPGQLPNYNFYIFGFIAVGSALRVITHPRPVYAALYFILTILASCGLYLILSAEFMAFALVIIYAGAILITYLFVIMLATQAPSEDHLESLADYDTQARAPFVAAVTGFVLLAALTTMLFRGVGDLPIPAAPHPDALLAQMPNKASPDKVMLALKRRGELREGDQFAGLDPLAGTVTLQTLDGYRTVAIPPEIKVGNVESIGFDLLNEHPGSIEIAGVILLMAMLGATVLSRKQVEFEEEAKLRQSQALAAAGQVFADKEVRP
jgi:NADH-quinone oxidoreductase subunit J